MSDLTGIERIPLEDFYGVEALSRPDGSPRILAFRVFGSLFFGAANKLESMLLNMQAHPEVLILDMEKVINIDTTGLDILQTLHRNLQKHRATLILCDLNAQPGSIVQRSGFLEALGTDNVAGNLTDALLRAQRVHTPDPGISYA
jgi:SulP family sulfate permease